MSPPSFAALRRCLSWACWAVVAIVAERAIGAESEPGFVPLFDGRTLEGWEGRPDLWRVEDGAITGETRAESPIETNEFLIWDGEAGDFILRLEFRLAAGTAGNSGVQYRARRMPEAGPFVVGGYQADIDGTNRYMGILYEERGRGILAERGEQAVLETGSDGQFARRVTASTGSAEELAGDVRPGAWARYEIVARGNRLIQRINGRTTVDVVDRDAPRAAARGIVALQLHVGPAMKVQFRNLRIKHLAGEAAAAGERPQETAVAVRGRVRALPGFRVERIYEVPQEEQGSWVALTQDARGRLIASDQGGGLYRITLPKLGDAQSSVRVERLQVDIGQAQGLCYAFESLYVMVNGQHGAYGPGLYRLRDADGDDQFDDVRQLRAFPGPGGEHGPHAIVRGPDGKSLYVCAGNHTDLPPVERSRAPRAWGEDHLLRRMWDAGGHAHGRMAPGGWIARTDPESKELELVSIGYRNEYDIAFNEHGDLFTYDSDMEWDIGAPWYRPTRVCHAVSGSEFGWRSGTGKWPVYYPDSLPATAEVGPGSPTGVAFGKGTAFPEKYQRALFVCDWSYGIIYALHLEPDGASYRGRLEMFVSAAPLPATDIVASPFDGALYFTVGGRNTQSALYRVTFDAAEAARSATPEQLADWSQGPADAALPAEAVLRRRLEGWHAAGHEDRIDAMWEALGHGDRFVRFAARTALEHQPVAAWSDRVARAQDVPRILEGCIALARCGSAEFQPLAMQTLGRLSWDDLDPQQRLGLLRAYALACTRWGMPDEAVRQALLSRLDRHFPAADVHLNYELCQLLVYLRAPGVAGRTLALLDAAPTQQEQIHYAFCLRVLAGEWTLEQRRQYLEWFHRAAAMRGGVSFAGFLNNCRQEAIDGMTAEEREALDAEIDRVPQTVSPLVELTARPEVQQWKMEDLLPDLEQAAADPASRDLERGERMFAAAQCFRCHRVGGDGERIGPDLTAVGGRFAPRDLLSSVLEPSKVISDQYRQTNFHVNGKVITGRIINLSGGEAHVLTDMFNPASLAQIEQSEIELQEDSDVSAMPAGLLNTLTKDEALDLLAFLMSGGKRP